jgi:pimeloyl-ACP methyl ester carboxylesterase
MIAAGLSGRGAQGHRGRSAFYDQQLQLGMTHLLELGSARCESAFTSINGRRLHYLQAGAGPPLVLLHGASGGAANWYRLIGPLAANFRVLAPDLPGFGFSDAIDPRAPLGHQVARVTADWLRALGVPRVSVVGTSFGGLVALRLPQYFETDRIVCIDSVGISKAMPWLLRLATLPLIARFVVAPTRAGTRALLRHALTANRLPRVHEDALVAYLFASAQRSDPRTLARAFVQFAGLSGQRDVVNAAELRAIADRLLLVWGEWDNFLPVSKVERVLALAGCGTVRIIPGAGHSPNWEQPEFLLKTIQAFL